LDGSLHGTNVQVEQKSGAQNDAANLEKVLDDCSGEQHDSNVCSFE
jgi:hypothetical protein